MPFLQAMSGKERVWIPFINETHTDRRQLYPAKNTFCWLHQIHHSRFRNVSMKKWPYYKKITLVPNFCNAGHYAHCSHIRFLISDKLPVTPQGKTLIWSLALRKKNNKLGKHLSYTNKSYDHLCRSCHYVSDLRRPFP